MKHEHFDEPVAAYEHLGSRYAELSRRREAYLRSVENCILERIPYVSSLYPYPHLKKK